MSPCKIALAGLALAASCAATAQLFPVDVDWKEAEVPPPPALRTGGLIELDSPRSDLRFAVDPASITLGKDRIVRYVVVARSAGGAVTGIYEGLNCKTAEAKVYARHNAGSGWAPAQDPKWRSIHEPAHLAYSLPIARQGGCVGHAPNANPGQIARDLRAPYDAKFTTQTR